MSLRFTYYKGAQILTKFNKLTGTTAEQARVQENNPKQHLDT